MDLVQTVLTAKYSLLYQLIIQWMIGPSALSSKIEVGMTPKKLWEAWTRATAMYRLKGFAFLKSKKNIKNRREVLTLLNTGVVLYSQGGVLQEKFII